MPVNLSAERPGRLEADLRAASERVKRRFEGRVDNPTVEVVVADVAGALAGARVKDYLGILVERMSVDRLNSILVSA
ncbi:MAG TPA: hypothetical protein VMU63_10660 [Acidimicrobiales bacterium]|nr:hypothetical protein [Acidimicrobiales bacterium]